MSDYSKTDIGSGYNTNTAVNTELGKVETAINSKVDKSGSTMTGDLDMNSNDILNTKNMDVQSLSINGTNVTAAGAAVSTLPDQSGNSTKVLSTDGSTAEWVQGSDKYFSTKAAALADTNLKVGEVVRIGDLGDGLFDVEAATTNNDSTVLNGSGSGVSLRVRKSEAGYYTASSVGCGTSDDTSAFDALCQLGGPIMVDVTVTLKPDTTGEITLLSGTTIMGLGKDKSIIKVSESSNPASSVHGFRLLSISDVCFKDLSIISDAETQGIFNLGSLSSGVYSPDGAGNLLGMRVSQCDNVTFENVSVEGFNAAAGVIFTNEDGVSIYNTNVKIINCDSRDNRETGFSLQAVDGFEIIGGLYEKNGLQVFDSVDAAGNPTSTTRTATNYIDGGTGYGIVVGRSTSANKLKCKNGVVKGLRTRRNVRHGIDIHAGVDIEIIDCHSEDDIISAFGIQDTAASLDSSVGDIAIRGGSITHTVYSENRGPLFDDRTTGVERDDSNPIFISNTASEIDQAIIDGVSIRDWRFRQISSYSATDTIMAITASANNKVIIKNVDFIANDADYYPSKIIQATSEMVVIDNNTFVYGTRGDFDRAAFRFESTDDNTRFTNNTIKEINVYSTGTTQVRHAMFERTGSTDEAIFTNNHITRSTQGTLGSLCETTSGNSQWGFRGYWGVNSDNIIIDATLGTVRYDERINHDLTFYISATGAGNQDGRDASNPFAANNLANLQLIADQLPEVDEKSKLSLQFADGAYTLSGTLTIPFDGWELLGNSGEFSAGTTKSVDFDNAGASDLNIVFPKYGRRSTMKGIQTRSANGLTVRDANILEFNVIENSGSGAGSDFCFYKETGESYVNSNYFTGGYASIGAFENATVVSRVNDDTGTQPTYGLNANGGIIMKNSTQPTGSTANELAANGGVIR